MFGQGPRSGCDGEHKFSQGREIKTVGNGNVFQSDFEWAYICKQLFIPIFFFFFWRRIGNLGREARIVYQALDIGVWGQVGVSPEHPDRSEEEWTVTEALWKVIVERADFEHLHPYKLSPCPWVMLGSKRQDWGKAMVLKFGPRTDWTSGLGHGSRGRAVSGSFAWLRDSITWNQI